MKSDSWGRRSMMLYVLPFLAFAMLSLSSAMFLNDFISLHTGILSPLMYLVSKWTALAAVNIYILAYSIGLSAQPWMISTEIFPVNILL